MNKLKLPALSSRKWAMVTIVLLAAIGGAYYLVAIHADVASYTNGDLLIDSSLYSPTGVAEGAPVLHANTETVSYSNGGTQMAYLVGNSDNTTSSLYVANGDGSSPKLLNATANANLHSLSIAWSPDNSLLAYVGYQVVGSNDQEVIVTVNALTGQQVATFATKNGSYTFGTIAWSHDGKSIAYIGQDYNKNVFSICLINIQNNQINCNDTNVSVVTSDASGDGYTSDQLLNAVSWSNDDKTILYSLQTAVLNSATGETEHHSVGSMSVNGTHDKQLVNNGAAATYSPDGTKISYIVCNDYVDSDAQSSQLQPLCNGSMHLVVANSDGSNPNVVNTFPTSTGGYTFGGIGNTYVISQQWLSVTPTAPPVVPTSPEANGKVVYFKPGNGVSSAGLYATDSTNATTIELKNQDNQDIPTVAWNPTGTGLAFSTTDVASGIRALDQVDANGLNEVSVTTNGSSSDDDEDAVYSKDGSSIFFVRNGTTAPGIYQVSTLGTGLKLISSAVPAYLSLSPDGTTLLYALPYGTNSIHSMATDGTNDQALSGIIAPRDTNLKSAIWAPDGRITASFINYDQNECYIVATNPDGSDWQLLYSGSNDCSAVSWSPDGTILAMSTADTPGSLSSTHSISLLNIKTGVSTPLLGATGQNVDQIAWQPVPQPPTGLNEWYISGYQDTQWGRPGDIPVPGNYSVANKTNYAVYRPSDDTWYIDGVGDIQYGAPGDIPIPGDYNGDGKTEIAIYRPSTGTFYIRGITTIQLGGYLDQGTDRPVVANFFGDGRSDPGLYNTVTGRWTVINLSYYLKYHSLSYVYDNAQYGIAGDIPVPGDYLSKTKASLAVYRPSNGTWYVNGGTAVQYGIAGDIPVPGDYNGAGLTEKAVYRPSNGTWYVNGYTQAKWGNPGDIPVPGTYNGGTKTEFSVFRP